MYDISAAARGKRIKTLLNSSRAVSPEPLRALQQYIDPLNLDFKALISEFYEATCFSQLEPVLKTENSSRTKLLGLKL